MGLTVGAVHEAIAATRPDRPCIQMGARTLTWREITDRSRRLANVLVARGLGVRRPREALQPWESGQDHLALYLYNGPEYLEAMLGAFKARVAPFNVNYRYVAEELAQLLRDASTTAVVYHSAFASTLAEVLPSLPHVSLLLQVADDSGAPLLPGAVWYEAALAASSPEPAPLQTSPDDLYILYTGGTTGAPKGVLWRQEDALFECFGGPPGAGTSADFAAAASSERRALLTAPLMHGAGHWVAFSSWHVGATIHLPEVRDRLDPADIWSIVERERIDFLLIVGDAFARPLVDELDRQPYDVSSLTVVLSGGAVLSRSMKDALLDRIPGAMILDGLGASESGGMLLSISSGAAEPAGRFASTGRACVLSEALDRELAPGDPEVGWLAKRGRLALGYLDSPAQTARTYPVIDGVRHVVPGDRASRLGDGAIEIHGRDAVTINSGGEKIFVEEVESALRSHPGVFDCVVAGRPSERWGSEVVAVIEPRPGTVLDPEELRAVAGRHLARFKLPKAFVFVDRIQRSPSGKADYRWARSVVQAGGEP